MHGGGGGGGGGSGRGNWGGGGGGSSGGSAAASAAELERAELPIELKLRASDATEARHLECAPSLLANL